MMLRLIMTQPGEAPRDLEWVALTAAGCLLGSAPDADLALSSPAGVRALGRIQAVVRLQGPYCELENLSALGQVSVNGHPLSAGQSAGLRPGDAVQIGDHHLKLETGDDASDTAVPEDEKPVDGIREEDAQDLFSSLLGGPGVIPVGSPTPPLSDGGETHVLSDTRPTILHDDEPLLEQHGRQDDIRAVLGSPGQEKS